MKRPTAAQMKALDLAALSGALRRLPGGYWVGNEHAHVTDADFVPAAYVGTPTVDACIERGWMTRDGDYRALVTRDGTDIARATALPATGRP